MATYIIMVIKECKHKCNPYFDPICIPNLKRESIIKFLSFRLLGGVRMLKVRAAVYRSAAIVCRIPTSSYLKLRKVTLIGFMGFSFLLWGGGGGGAYM